MFVKKIGATADEVARPVDILDQIIAENNKRSLQVVRCCEHMHASPVERGGGYTLDCPVHPRSYTFVRLVNNSQ